MKRREREKVMGQNGVVFLPADLSHLNQFSALGFTKMITKQWLATQDQCKVRKDVVTILAAFRGGFWFSCNIMVVFRLLTSLL